MTEGRRLAKVERADGSREDVTFALVRSKRRFGHTDVKAVDFRTTDGEPLVLAHDDALEVDFPFPPGV